MDQEVDQLLEVAVQRPGQQQVLRRFAAAPGAVACSEVESKLRQEFGPGNLCSDDEVVLLPTVLLRPGTVYTYVVFAGAPQMYENITLHIAADPQNEAFVRGYPRVSRATLQKVLDGMGCDLVRLPGSDTPQDFQEVQLHDNMVLEALRFSKPWEARMSTVEGLVLPSATALEQDATETMAHQVQQQQHSNVQVLAVRHIKSVDGRMREVDGAVVADDCAAILEAKQVLDDTAVPQLTPCLEFIRDNELQDDAAQLKQGKKLVGFRAGRTLSSDPGAVKRLVTECEQRGYSILVSSGQSLSLGNTRVPRLRVDCAMRTRVRAPSSAVRALV